MRLLLVAMAVMLHELVTLVAIISCPGMDGCDYRCNVRAIKPNLDHSRHQLQ
jgi:hypothetical protein